MHIVLKSEKYKFIPNVDVTPAMAKEWLKTTPGNRGLSNATVIEYAEMMRQGRWHQNGNVVKFDVDGLLRDGHHRLNALILADRSIVMDLVLGVEVDALYSIDCGRTRRLSDFLRMFSASKGKHGNHRAGYLAHCVQIVTGTVVPIRTLDEYDRWMVPFGPGVEWALRDLVGFKLIKNAPVAGSLAFAYKTDPDAISFFGSQVCSGEHLSVGDPAHTLRRLIFEGYVPGEKMRSGGKCSTARKVFNCAMAALRGRKLQKVYDTTEGQTFFRQAYLSSASVKALSRPWAQQVPGGAADANANAT